MIFAFFLTHSTLGSNADGKPRRLDPQRLCDDPRGLTGTEVQALGLAHILAALGHTIHCYSHWTAEDKHSALPLTFYDIRRSSFPADIAVAFHDSTPLLTARASFKIAWHQTLKPPHALRMHEEKVDACISATAVNALHLSLHYGAQGIPWYVVPNGCDFGTYQEYAPAAGRLGYHTSAERGLIPLLTVLPAIVARCPWAHLFVAGDLFSIQAYPGMARRLEALLEVNEQHVTLLGACSRNQILEALSRTEVLPYPSAPPAPCEVMPVSVMEACRAGTPVVCAPSDGFEKAFGGALCLTPTPTLRHLKRFGEVVAEVLEDRWLRNEFHQSGRYWASQHTFARSAEAFLAVIEGKGEPVA